MLVLAGDFGKLVPDHVGMLRYESMLEYVKVEERDFRNVWGVHSISKGVIFQTNNYLFRWDGSRLKSWKSDHRLHMSYSLFDRFFVKKDSVGLLELSGDSLLKVPQGESFANERVFMMEPLHDGSIMIGSQEGIDGPLQLKKLSEFGVSKIPVDPLFSKTNQGYTYYNGTKLNKEDYLAIATLNDGLFIFDTDGHLVETLGADRSIPNDVTSVYEDSQGGLWISHYTSGITHAGDPFSLSEYDMPGNLVNDIVRFQSKLYIATDEGLFTLNDRPIIDTSESFSTFEPVDVESTTRMFFSLEAFGDQLLIATDTGVYSFVDGSTTLVAFNYRDKPRFFYASHQYKNRIYVGLEAGLGVMSYESGIWKWDILDDKRQPITSIVEAPDGSLWICRKGIRSEIWRLELNESGINQTESVVIDQEMLDTTISNDWSLGLFRNKIGIVIPHLGVYTKSFNETDFILDKSLTNSEGNDEFISLVQSIDKKTYITFFRIDQLSILLIIMGR